ncbi:MAG: hypothetical protein J2P23_13675 [Microlunatus sp.]|nr:hypothetical protein [Microlunatus sp.]
MTAKEQGASALIAREVRAELGRQRLSLRQFATVVDKDKKWITRRLSTLETQITFDDIKIISDALGVPVVQFIGPWLKRAQQDLTK